MKLRLLAVSALMIFSLEAQASICLQNGFVAAHNSTQQIIDAFKARDTGPIADLMVSFIANGPSQDYVSSSKFEDVFSEKSRDRILALEGTEEQCIKIGYKGFMMGRGSIWLEYAPESHIGIVPITSLNNAEPVKAKTAKASSDFWQSDAGPLHPHCFAYEWYSSDNYELVGEHFGVENWGDFMETPAPFFGSEITDFDLIETGWANPDKLHIGFKTSQCTSNQPEMVIDDNFGVKAKTCGQPCSFHSYKLLNEFPLDRCNELASNFKGECKSSYFAMVTEGSTDSNHTQSSWIVYGLFDSDEHGEVIFPLKNFYTKDQATEFLE